MIANTSDEHALSYRLRKQRICGDTLMEIQDYYEFLQISPNADP